MNPRLRQRLHLVGSRALASGDDGSGMAHTSPGRRGLSGDETDDWLLHMFFDVGGSGLFGRASDLADQDDRLGAGVFIKQLEGVDVIGADDGVAADSDGG